MSAFNTLKKHLPFVGVGGGGQQPEPFDRYKITGKASNIDELAELITNWIDTYGFAKSESDPDFEDLTNLDYSYIDVSDIVNIGDFSTVLRNYGIDKLFFGKNFLNANWGMIQSWEYAFEDLYNLGRNGTNIGSMIDLEFCTSIDGLFLNCKRLTQLPRFANCENIVSAERAFMNCKMLTVNPEYFNDFVHLENGNSMFNNVEQIEEGTFNFVDLVDAKYMFANNNVISEVSIEAQGALLSTIGMFSNCEMLNYVYIADTSTIQEWNEMFYSCKYFNQDISSWDTESAVSWDDIFLGCDIEEEYKPELFR